METETVDQFNLQMLTHALHCLSISTVTMKVAL